MPILSRVRGVIEEKRADALILFAGGLGFEILVPLSTLSQLPEAGKETTLRTYLHVREGAIGLYGFLTAQEQRMFELLLTVGGVGPKSALSCLSLHSVAQLSAAIASGDIAALQRVPGVGRRTAERIVLELKSRVGDFTPAGTDARRPVAQNEVIEALMFYGYSASEAAAAVATIPGDRELTLEEQTMWALRYFAPRAERKAGPE
jgi:Holliday junction DNA helicase RuvA